MFLKYNRMGLGWVASPLITLADHRPAVGLWFTVGFFYHLPLYSGIVGGHYAHTRVDRTIRAAGRPAGPSGTCLPPHGPLKDTQIIGVRRSRTEFVSSHCHFEQQSLKQDPPLPTCEEWSVPCASPLDNMAKWGLATGLLYFCPSSGTCLAGNLR